LDENRAEKGASNEGHFTRFDEPEEYMPPGRLPKSLHFAMAGEQAAFESRTSLARKSQHRAKTSAELPELW
jgi:hypothetical protein